MEGGQIFMIHLIHCKKLTFYLIGPVPVVTTSTHYIPLNNRPHTVTCTVTFAVAVPLEMVTIQWTNLDGILLTNLSDRIKVSQIRQISENIFAHDAIFNPLKFEDNGTYVCGAGLEERFPISRHAYEPAHIYVISKHIAVSYVILTTKSACILLLVYLQATASISYFPLQYLPFSLNRDCALLLSGIVPMCLVDSSVDMNWSYSYLILKILFSII